MSSSPLLVPIIYSIASTLTDSGFGFFQDWIQFAFAKADLINNNNNNNKDDNKDDIANDKQG